MLVRVSLRLLDLLPPLLSLPLFSLLPLVYHHLVYHHLGYHYLVYHHLGYHYPVLFITTSGSRQVLGLGD